MSKDMIKNSSLITETATFKVNEIPQILYQEISAHFGIGEEKEEDINNVFWKRRELNSALPIVGFDGTIGFERWQENSRFYFWPFLFSNIKDREEVDYYLWRPVLSILAGPREAGVWRYGAGNLMAGSINASLKLDDIPLNSPTVRFMARFATMILFRASQIACDPRCVREKYWEVQKDPSGDYTGEDDDY